ncbi:MAG: STAS domain-containing protein [Spirochaetes bacterium]|nr:STAS domain-containing protein [Spirochaetota bacterium]
MKVLSNDNIDIVVLDGRIDQDASAEMESLLQGCMNKGRYNICIDMINVKHICSSALGVLVAVKRKMKDREGDIKLVIADDNLLKLFQTTMLDRVFEIYESQRECLGAFD